MHSEYPVPNYKVNRRVFLGAAIAAPLGVAAAESEWISLFDGHTLNGWRPSENKNSWQVVDGMLTANGPRSHLFYAGPIRGADFKNFELEVEVTTQPECNSGVYIHTAYQEKGFPEKGFEIQINNTARGEGGYLERKKTGSLYGLRNMYKQLVPDGKPFTLAIAVRGKRVQVRLNQQLLVDYVEPTPPVIPEGGEKQRFLDHGTFALQCHNDGSRAAYRSVRVRPLPDDLPAYTGPAPVVDETYRRIINLGRHNVPLVDFHVNLRDGMTLDSALRKSRSDGLQYGITGDAASLKSDADAHRWLATYAGKPVFTSLLSANGNWSRTISRQTASQFDCILADGRTQVSGSGGSGAEFVDKLVDQLVSRFNSEPIDVYAYPLSLPAGLKANEEALWTEARMDKLIEALVRNQVAVELNTVEKLPTRSFIERAKKAGCKFALGTGNRSAQELARCEYGLQMMETCALDWRDFYAPGAWWPKAIERRFPS